VDIRASSFLVVALVAANATAAPGGAARAWETWPEWAYVEAGSAAELARLDETWGGLDKLCQGQLADLVTTQRIAATSATVRTIVDDTRPVRILVGRGAGGQAASAIVFAPKPRSELPASCARVAELVVCGSDPEANALRDDVLARGLTAAAGVHVEQHSNFYRVPTRAVLDAIEDHGALHATVVATPRQAPSASVSQAALAAASRIAATASHVEIGSFSAFDTDLTTPLSFDGAQNQVFVEMPVDKLAAHMVPFWRSFSGNGMSTRVDTLRAPAGFPAGTRRFRKREWQRDSGDITQCTPDQMGGCRVVGHRPAVTRLANDDDILLVPADGGTWIVHGGDPEGLRKLKLLFASAAASPPTWTLPAVAAGKLTTPRADVWWVQTLRAPSELVTEIAGQARP
jgi:hypothetical protein